MEIEFIHVGMPKTATTSLQNVWLRDPSYCLSHLGSSDFVKIIQEAIVLGKYNTENVSINVDTPYIQGQKVVLSNESFSAAFLMVDPELQKKSAEYIELCSNSLNRFIPDCNKVLLVVRDPVSWIRSAYIQSIKMGGHGDCEDFINKNHFFFLCSLDLKNIVSAYEKNFKNVLVLPYELFKSDSAEFFKILCERFQLPMLQSDTKVPALNVSSEEKKIYALSCLNRLSAKLFGSVSNSASYLNLVESASLQPEWDSFKNNYLITNTWLHRRFIEHANKNEIDEVCDMLNVATPPDNFFDFSIGKQLESKIREDFISYLRAEELIEEQYLSLYESNLNSMTA